MGTRIKKTKSDKDSEGRSNFDGTPLDLVIEIIGRLPVKSLARFLLVSKLWESIIRSRDFITSYPYGSSSQPRLLVAFLDLDKYKRRLNCYFFRPSWCSSICLLSRATCPFPNPVGSEYYTRHVNGFVSLAYGQEQVITNPSTGKSLIIPRDLLRKRFFGYDLVTDQYKVLCMDKKQSSQPHVITLGSNKEEWRMIECSIPHKPSSTSLCIDSVVYYLAYTGTDLSQPSLMSFDLRSEEFNLLTSLPSDTEDLSYPHMINYKGKVAISCKTKAYTFIMWAIDQNAEKYEWLRISFSIEPLKKLFQETHYLPIIGTTPMGELILAPSCYSHRFNVVFYNPHKNSFRSVKMEVNPKYKFSGGTTRAFVFPEYVESVKSLLERRFLF